MNSIYKKISLVLIASFVAEIFIVGLFYRQVVVSKVLVEINKEGDKRQYLLKEITNKMQKTKNDIAGMEKIIKVYSTRYDIDFIIKKIDGEVIYGTKDYTSIERNKVQEQVYIKGNGKNPHIMYAYFPTKLEEIDNMINSRKRIIAILIFLLVSSIVFFIIYRILTDPLKKLSKAVKNINYGNTEVSIPYDGDDEFGMLCRNFEEMGRRLKISEENQRELIQAVSHDIKTPLTSILGYSKRLTEGKVKSERIEEYHSIILKKSLDLEYLILELEDYVDINSNTLLNIKSINVKDFLRKLHEDFKRELQEYGVDITLYHNIEEDFKLPMDDKKVKRVFQNIISNSIKYAGENIHIEINCFKNNNKVCFEIKDNGIGVPESYIDKIFDRFYRVDGSRSREKGGTGLGLSICKTIINLHGGDIGARSKGGEGLLIWFTLPCK